MDQTKKSSALILSAGISSRMGRPKFMLRFDESHTFLEKIIAGYKQFGCDEIIVVLNPQNALIFEQSRSKIIERKQIVINHYPEKERFCSIQTGLKTFRNVRHVFIHPVDNPFINQNVLEKLLKDCIHGDYQVPTYLGKGGHPILLSEKLINNICNLSDCNFNFKTFLMSFDKKVVPVQDPEILININTKEDYKQFIKQ